MILYNVTIKINARTEADWLEWMRSVHIPDVMNTGLFESYKLCRLLHNDDEGGTSYAIQYFCENMETFQHYQNNQAPTLQAEHTERYKGQYVAFRTLMEVLE